MRHVQMRGRPKEVRISRPYDMVWRHARNNRHRRREVANRRLRATVFSQHDAQGSFFDPRRTANTSAVQLAHARRVWGEGEGGDVYSRRSFGQGFGKELREFLAKLRLRSSKRWCACRRYTLAMGAWLLLEHLARAARSTNVLCFDVLVALQKAAQSAQGQEARWTPQLCDTTALIAWRWR